jgi:hypothetical protein
MTVDNTSHNSSAKTDCKPESNAKKLNRWDAFWKRQRDPKEQEDRWLTLLPLFSLLGVIALVAYAATSHHFWSVTGYGAIVALSSTLAGGLVGILFGIPRSLEDSQTQTNSEYKGNTNLEQVSDWLTKILVGVGLVQLGHAPDALEHLANSMKSGFGAGASSASFGLALSLSFAIAGFIYFYLWSRIFLPIDLPRNGKAKSKTECPTDASGTEDAKDPAKDEGAKDPTKDSTQGVIPPP